jgi:hypothetical protein
MRVGTGLGGTLILGAGIGLLMAQGNSVVPQAADGQGGELAALKLEVARLKAVVPDQAHAMSDVGSHFTNLWFAGANENWPLAQFFCDETRSHLRWAVRIIPKRKDAEGREIDLQGILTGLESSTFKDLDQSIKEKDKAKFAPAYRAQMEGCMSCHRASNKPYLRLHVPEKADAGILEFRPE